LKIHFYKYEGTGNDFILIDNRNNIFKNSANEISRLCDRKFGIGADGLILLNKSKSADFEMLYYNADGHEVNMCGNGGRCIIAFAKLLGIIKNQGSFMASDGLHKGKITNQDGQSAYVKLSIRDVASINKEQEHFIIDTGVPHYVMFVSDQNSVNVVEEGRKIRYSPKYSEKGINVDFCQVENGALLVRTYERGVEDETLSCGTGVTAASIAAYLRKDLVPPIRIIARGGELDVDFNVVEDQFKDVWLSGPVSLVYQGEIPL